MDLLLKDKTALGTGASVGIGRGIALALAAEGVRLAITARRIDKLLEVADELVALGAPSPVLIEQNMYADDAAKRIADAAVAGLGQVDILVNNAGGSRSFKDLHVSEAQWQEAMTLNFHRPRQLGDVLIDQMIARGWGRIINITGKSEPEHINGAFCAKAGMHSWAKGLSRMVGKHGITVNAFRQAAFIPNKSTATTRRNTDSGSARTRFLQAATASRKTWPTWWPSCLHPGPATLRAR